MDGKRWITKNGYRILINNYTSHHPVETTSITNDYMNNKIKKTYTSTNSYEEEKQELKNVFEQIEDEMINQDKHSYDIKSNDTDEMMFFIDEVVKPIVNSSNLNEEKKKEVIGYMIMDVNDNKRWSIKTGVKAMKDWYKLNEVKPKVYRGGDGSWIMDLPNGQLTPYGTSYIQGATKQDVLNEYKYMNKG